MHIVRERVHEGDDRHGIEVEPIEVAAEISIAVDDMEDRRVNPLAVVRREDLVSIACGKLARRLVAVARRWAQEYPIDGVEIVRGAVILQGLGRVARGIGGDRDELHLIAHRRSVDHPLDLGDEIALERAEIGAVCVDEVEHHDFILKLREIPGMPIGVDQRERRGLALERMEQRLVPADLIFQRLERVRAGRQGGQRRDARDQNRH